MPAREMVPFLFLADPFSALLHVTACLVFLWVSSTLLEAAGSDRRRLRAAWRYSIATSAMFLFSATYHALPSHSAWRPLFWRLDHGSIWLAIVSAGCMIQATFLPRWTWARAWRRLFWGAGITGSLLELTVLDLLPMWVSPLLYICIGWSGLPMVIAAWKAGVRQAPVLCFVSGVLATLGGLMDSLTWPMVVPGVIEAHECMHLATTAAGLVWLLPIWLASRETLELRAERAMPAPLLVNVHAD